ncbi:DUF6056 family protein [Macrococcus capreoli]|uniref:DUF6056 family protein n=1 Tax=Macrococcus capreoli TaxID=2982690 RepID=UPI0021D5702A|nr:DUF6056 family protein [Macrococcus sp. TMW 2.2395]MCU7557525.1 DUF6056 family protein [Macrococcus sp. TMW 2.2395]
MNLKQLTNKKVNAFAFIFLFYLIMSMCIPLTGDDWTWKSARGIERLQSWFDNYNGRYISNILEIVLVRASLLKVLFMTVVSFLTVVYMNKLMHFKLHPLISFILVCLLPLPVFAQTYGWVAGYVNYNISILLVLITLNLYQTVTERTNYRKLLAYVSFAFIAMLFVEHVSLYLLIMSLYFNGLYYYHHKRINKALLALLVGHVIGFIVMFTNKAYVSIFVGEDTYRTIKDDRPFIVRAIQIFVEQMNALFGVYNIPLLTILFVVFILLLRRYNVNRYIIMAGIYLFTLNIITNLELVKVLFNTSEMTTLHSISALLLLSSFIYMFTVVILYRKQAVVFRTVLFYLIGFALLTGPFFVITPYGGRCALASLIFMIMIILVIIDHLMSDTQIAWTYRYHYHILAFTVVFGIIAYLIPLSANKITEMHRDAELKDMKATNKSVPIKMLPYPEYHQMPDPIESVYMTQFYKENLNIPQSVKLVPENNK